MSNIFAENLNRLQHDIVQQAGRVEALTERAFEAVFSSDAALAKRVIAEDDLIDRVDVEIERRAVEVLALREDDAKRVRQMLTIVKVNNELERIADLAADIAEQVVVVGGSLPERLPLTMRVMCNSVIGMIRDAGRALRASDAKAAQTVLAQDDLIVQFKARILKEVHERLAGGQCSIDYAGAMWQIAGAVERMAAHTANICEQIIYVETGRIVRHSSGGWSEPMSVE